MNADIIILESKGFGNIFLGYVYNYMTQVLLYFIIILCSDQKKSKRARLCHVLERQVHILTCL